MPSPPRNVRRKSPSPPRRWPRLLLHAVLALSIPLALGLIWLDASIQREFSGKKWAVPALVYGRPQELYAGAAITPQALLAERDALGYRPGGSTLRTGGFHSGEGWVRVAVRGFRFWDGVEPSVCSRCALQMAGSPA